MNAPSAAPVAPVVRGRAAAWRRWLLPVAAGLSGALAFPLVLPGLGDEPALDAMPREVFILLAAALLYRFSREPISLKRRMLAGWVAGSVHFAVLIYWLNIAMVRFGHMPQWQALPVLALLVLYCGAYWALLPPTMELLRLRGRIPPALAFAFAVVLLEWLRGLMLTGFPWGLWGYSQARNLALIQLAGVAGVYGVSWVIAYAGALVTEYAWARHTRRAMHAGVRFGALVAAAHGIGWVLMVSSPPEPGPGIEVAALQGSIDQETKNRDIDYRSMIVRRYEQLTSVAATRGADLVVWPEAAWPGRVSARSRRLGRLSPGVPVLVGISALERGPPRTLRNAAFWLDGDGRVLQRYDKQHLVPFGEYVPLRTILPVNKFVPGLLDYSAGTSAAPMGEPAVGVLICYDGIFPEIARAEVNAGATLLANLTNDAWYGISSAAYQHRDFYVLRAVETDRWVVRAANTGLSLFIDPAGRLHDQTRIGDVTLTQRRIYPRTGRTPYVRFGDWLVAISIGAALGGLLDRVWRWFRARRESAVL